MNIIVIKFGSSVLRDHYRFTCAANIIRRFLDNKYKVIAVVSAIGDTTDQIYKKMEGCTDEQLASKLYEQGEKVSVDRLVQVLSNDNVNAYNMDFRCIKTESEAYVDSSPEVFDANIVKQYLNQYSILVIPGFVGENSNGKIATFERGGSDYTALFIAKSIGANQCILVKDEKAIYQMDPKKNPSANFYTHINYIDLLKFKFKIVQQAALYYALKNDLNFSILGKDEEQPGTLIYSGLTILNNNHPSAAMLTAFNGIYPSTTRVREEKNGYSHSIANNGKVNDCWDFLSLFKDKAKSYFSDNSADAPKTLASSVP